MKIDQTKISLRKATITDIDLIVEYRLIFLKESQGNAPIESEPHLRQSLKDYLTLSLEKKTFISWIAEYETKPVGFSGMVIREQPGTFDIPQGKTGYVLNMFTIMEYRKNGIASMLFHKLIEEARQNNLDRIDLHATNAGEPIYRRFGFEEPHDKVLEFILK